LFLPPPLENFCPPLEKSLRTPMFLVVAKNLQLAVTSPAVL
jgi:hypothetical protein